MVQVNLNLAKRERNQGSCTKHTEISIFCLAFNLLDYWVIYVGISELRVRDRGLKRSLEFSSALDSGKTL